MSKERLIKILRGFEFKCPKDCLSVNYKDCNECKFEQLAEYLLANGAIVPPCWIGDKIYFVCGYNIAEYTVERAEYDLTFWQFHCENPKYDIEHREFSFFDERIGKTVFLTREEAEAKLKESESNA